MGLSPMSANLSRAAAPRFAHASAGTGAPINDCHTINPLRQCSPTGRFANRLPFKSHSAHRARRKRQRLPPSLLIESASDLDPAPPLQSAPRRFRSRLATIRPEPSLSFSKDPSSDRDGHI
jgi:hypothetical protein